MHKLTSSQWLIVGTFAVIIPISIFFMSYPNMPVRSGTVAKQELTDVLNIESWQSDEGPSVYFVERSANPMVDIQLYFDAGSARDVVPGEAYLLAQMLERGTQEYTADEFLEKIESVGAEFSVSVDRDKTLLHCRTLSDSIALNQVIDLLGSLLKSPRFDKDDFDQINSQLAMRLTKQSDEPNVQASLHFHEAVYGDHPYAQPIRGSLDSITKIQLGDIQRFHQQYYGKDNMTVVVVGDVSAGRVDSWVRSWSESMPAGHKGAPLSQVAPKAASEAIHQNFDSSQTHIRYGLPVETPLDADHFSLKVAEQVLGGGFSSRLYKQVRKDRGLAYSVSARSNEQSGKGLFYIRLETRSDMSEEAVSLITDMVKTFIEGGPTEQELADAKAKVKAQTALLFSSNGWIASHVGELAYYKKPLSFYDTYAKNLEAVTAEQVKETLQRRAPVDHWQLVTVGPA